MFNKKKTKTTKTKQKTILTKQIFQPKVYAGKTLGIINSQELWNDWLIGYVAQWSPVRWGGPAPMANARNLSGLRDDHQLFNVYLRDNGALTRESIIKNVWIKPCFLS